MSCTRHWAFGFFGLLMFASAPLTASSTAWRMCDDCSEPEKMQCAVTVAQFYGLQTADQVWILDFLNESASKFYLHVGSSDEIIRGNDSRSDGESLAASSILAFDSPLTSDELDGAYALFQIVNQIYRPAGFGFNYPSCDQAPMAGAAPDMASPSATPMSQAGATYVRNIPGSSGFGSAYDVIGFNQAAVALARQYAGLAGGLGMAQSFVSNWVAVSPLNTTVSLKIVFPDGSYGIWRYDFEHDSWQPDWSTFRDSEDNLIPLTEADMPPGTVFLFEDDENLANFLDRAALFGIPITGPGGGGTAIVCMRDASGIVCSVSSF